MTFKPANPHQNLPDLEEKIIQSWQEKDIFKRSVEERDKEKSFHFYDGPPFATGLPHYGHILASTLKDVVPRFWTMRGYRVERVWGWDCHGLPVENIVEEELELGSKEEIENYGVDKFCEDCRSKVLRYTEEWKKTITRLGRFVDMENAYHTMDLTYMDSVWWVFSKLWEEDLIYESLKSIHYCPRCDTPLSNFEVTQGYADITDESVYAKFELANEPGTYLLAWTTTPWTLPGNVALAVGENIEYVKVKVVKYKNKDGSFIYSPGDEKTGTPELIGEEGPYILAKDQFKNVFGIELEQASYVETVKAKDLIEQKYIPLFSYFEHPHAPEAAEIIDPEDKIEDLWKNYCTIQSADFVSTEDGTGIVHIAPAFGEDDFNLAKSKKLPLLRHVKPNGRFIEKITEFADEEVKPKKDPSLMDHRINEFLDSQQKVLKIEKYRHSYPHCWRCDTPLLNYTAPSWFVRVEKLKKDMLAANEQINWVPDHLKHGRFGHWLSNARDWAISRNRFWGAPLPVWRCDHCGDTVCVDSAEKLNELSGEKVTDLHKHFVDKISWPCKTCTSGQSVKITFVRHGSTEWNEEHRLQSDSDIPLDNDGIQHAEDLKKEINAEDYDIIISSPLRRAHETAEILAPGKEIIIDDIVREASCGEFEGKTVQEVIDTYHDINDKKDIRWASKYEVETPEETKHKVLEFYKKMEKKYADKKVLVVTHGHFLHVIKWMEENKEETFSEKFPNLYEMKRTIVPTYYRIPEVLDCWFESGSMPYAQFGTKEKTNIPADFIAEGLDQTRGWFYTLTVLASALSSHGKLENISDTRPAFKNCIVNGIVLAEDGKKMSKRLKNYPEPSKVFHKHGADAMRFYILNSPVVKAEDFRFSEDGVSQTVRQIILPLWNTYSFLVTYANTDNWSNENIPKNFEAKNPLDKWILSKLNHLIRDITEELESYHLFEATNEIPKFLDELTNWYVRRSRRRFWKTENDNDKNDAYTTLYIVLKNIVKIMAPFCPFVTDEIYQNLTKEDSVHLSSWPSFDESKIDLDLEKEIDGSRIITELGHALRSNEKIKVRQPLSKIFVALPENYSVDSLEKQKEVILEELNIKEMVIMDNPEEIATPILKPNAKVLGPRIGGKVQEVIKAANNGEFKINENDQAEVAGEVLEKSEYTLQYKGKEDTNCTGESGFVISLDANLTPELILEGQARDLIREIQDLRKEAGLEVSDRIKLSIKNADEIIKSHEDYIKHETLAKEIVTEEMSKGLKEKEIKIGEKNIILNLKKFSG